MTTDHNLSGMTLCAFCGAYSMRACDLREEAGGECPWEEMEPDPDRLREDRDERLRLEQEYDEG